MSEHIVKAFTEHGIVGEFGAQMGGLAEAQVANAIESIANGRQSRRVAIGSVSAWPDQHTIESSAPAARAAQPMAVDLSATLAATSSPTLDASGHRQEHCRRASDNRERPSADQSLARMAANRSRS